MFFQPNDIQVVGYGEIVAVESAGRRGGGSWVEPFFGFGMAIGHGKGGGIVVIICREMIKTSGALGAFHVNPEEGAADAVGVDAAEDKTRGQDHQDQSAQPLVQRERRKQRSRSLGDWNKRHRAACTEKRE